MLLWFIFCCYLSFVILLILSLISNIKRSYKLQDISNKLSIIKGVEGATYSSFFLDGDSISGTDEAVINVAVWDHGIIDRVKLLDLEDYIKRRYHQIVNIHVTAHQGRGVDSVLTFGKRLF